VARIFDLHNDLPTANVAAEKFDKKSKIVHVFWTTKLTGPISFVMNYLVKAKQDARIFYAIEDLHFIKCVDVLKKLCVLPFLYMGLTWNEDNRLAGGCYGEKGLTTLGLSVIKVLNEKNVAVDTAHLNKKSFDEVLEHSNKVLCSHTCLDSIFSHKRNLTDKQITDLIAKGGVVGIATAKEFFGEKYKYNRIDYLMQIDTFAQKFGVNNLCIGTDFHGTAPLDGLKKYKDFDLLQNDLIKLGYTSEQIGKIFFSNADGFFNPPAP